MIIDANRVDPGARVTADVCIIGAGAAGITLALELSRNNISAVLLTGGQKKERPWDRDLYRGVTDLSYPHEPLEQGRRRAFGGTTIAWGGRCMPLDPMDFQKRSWIPGSGWPIAYADLLPHYTRAIELCEASPFSFDASETFGPERAPMISGFDGAEVTSSRLERWSPPTNFAKRYAPELRKAPLLQVLVGGHALHIQVKATGRSIDYIRAASQPGRGFFIHARLYVLAAGGLENPRLLLVSDDIHTSGIGNSAGLVGRYYMTHLLGAPLKVSFADRGPAFHYDFERDGAGVYCRRRFALTPFAQEQHEIGNASASLHRPPIADAAHGNAVFSAAFLAKQYADAFKNGGARDFRVRLRKDSYTRREHWEVIRQVSSGSAIEISKIFRSRYLVSRRLPMVLPDRSVSEHYLHYQAEHAPNRDSRVVLNGERDAFGLRRLTARISFSDVDARTVAEVHRIIADRLEKTQTGHLIFDEARIQGHISNLMANFNSEAHQLGTTRMSDSSRDGVVDANCRSHEVDDLFVVGGSVFPTSGYANPLLTIVALSVRLAAHLRERLREGVTTNG